MAEIDKFSRRLRLSLRGATSPDDARCLPGSRPQNETAGHTYLAEQAPRVDPQCGAEDRIHSAPQALPKSVFSALRHEWRPTPLLVLQRNSSVPNFRREGRKVEGLRKPGLTALNRTTALQDELSRLRAQIARIVASDSGVASVGSFCTFCLFLRCRCTAPVFTPENFFRQAAVHGNTWKNRYSKLCPSVLFSGLGQMLFSELHTPTYDPVSLSKSTSFADVMDILKDMNRMKMSKDRFSRGCTSLRDEDSASLISEALRKKFTLRDEDVLMKEK
nr:PREDICTED: mitochondrial fission regulator 1-like [Lepisosteus oculatus]